MHGKGAPSSILQPQPAGTSKTPYITNIIAAFRPAEATGNLKDRIAYKHWAPLGAQILSLSDGCCLQGTIVSPDRIVWFPFREPGWGAT